MSVFRYIQTFCASLVTYALLCAWIVLNCHELRTHKVIQTMSQYIIWPARIQSCTTLASIC